MATPSYDDCVVATARVSRAANPCKLVWDLQGLNDATTRQILLTHSKLNMKVTGGEFDYCLEFDLITESNDDEHGNNCKYLKLMATMISKTLEMPTSFDIQVDSLEGSHPTVNIPRNYICMKARGRIYVGNLIMLNLSASYTGRQRGYKDTDYTDQISKSFCIGITVTPIICNFVDESIVKNGVALYPNLPSSSTLQSNLEALSRDFQKMYLDGQDNYTDLKLESKDGTVISVHKFVLAARCPAFKELIEMAMKQNGFDGTIMIKEVNAKPLMAMLYWMYTGKLQDGTEKFLEELIAAAVKYEMRELLELLDKELIKICNKGNMLQLLMMAQKNEMEFAIKQISKFIKENL